VTMIVKVIVLIIIGVAALKLPSCDICYVENFVHTFQIDRPVLRSYQTWDAQLYLEVAQYWYRPDHQSIVFYPLFPLLIKLVTPLAFGNAFVAGMLVSAVASVTAMIVLFALVEKLHSREIAWRTVLILLAFPTAFYFHLIYSEGLFLLIVCVGFLAVVKRQRALAVAAHLLMPLTRLQGMMVGGAHIMSAVFTRKQWRDSLLAAAAAFSGFGIYLLFMWVTTGSPFAAFTLQGSHYKNYSVSTLFHPLDWARNNILYFQPGSIVGFTYQLVNRAFFWLFLVLLPLVYYRVRRDLFWFTLILGGVTILSGNLVSWPRYMLTLFPLFIPLAYFLKTRIRLVSWCIATVSLQIFFLMLHSQNYWFA